MKLLSFLILQPGIFCTAWFLRYAAELRRPLAYSLLSTGITDLLWLLNNVLLDIPVLWINAIGYPVCYLLLPLLFAKPSGRLRAVSVQMLLMTLPYLVCFLADLLLRSLAAGLGWDTAPLYDPRQFHYAAFSLVLNVLMCFTLYGTARLLGRLLSAPVAEGKSLLWFLAVPFSQLILITLLLNLYFYRDDPVSAPILTGLCVGLCVGSDMACILGFRKYRRMQQADRLLGEVRRQLSLQAEHYESLQTDILRINKIRHDLQNQLQAAIYLMKSGNSQEADNQLELLNRQLSEKVGSQFCENLMVDAVLTEKARQCESQNIRLLVSAPVPRQTHMESTSLCSAFSNLLDNAMEATLLSDSPKGPINLYGDIHGDYLTISCKNPAKKPEVRKNSQLLRTHGLGLDILREIAQTHGGSFRTQWKDGIFYANLTVRI